MAEIEQILEEIEKGKISYLKNSELAENELRLYRIEALYAYHEETINFVIARNLKESLTLLKDGVTDWNGHKVEKIEEYSLREPKFIDQIEGFMEEIVEFMEEAFTGINYIVCE